MRGLRFVGACGIVEGIVCELIRVLLVVVGE